MTDYPKDLRKKAEIVALDTFMSSYPEEAESIEEVLALLEEEDGEDDEDEEEKPLVWEPFEGWEPDDLADSMDSLASNVEEALQEAYDLGRKKGQENE